MIISLSGKKRSGKSTVAQHLVAKHGFIEVSWAEPIKEIIGKQIFGLTDDQLYGPEEIREEIIPEWGMSARQILQIVGTDLFRDQIHPDIWVRKGMRDINEMLDRDPHTRIVISDTRFPNEAHTIREANGVLVQIRKIGNSINKDVHPSETSLDDFEFDYLIQAAHGYVETLKEKIDMIVKTLGSENAFSEK